MIMRKKEARGIVDARHTVASLSNHSSHSHLHDLHKWQVAATTQRLLKAGWDVQSAKLIQANRRIVWLP